MIPTLPVTVDVVVLGGGLAGHCAALEASRAGACVALLEKAHDFGGSTAAGPGVFAFAGTDLQQRLGIKDSPELFRADLLAAGHGYAREDLVDCYVDHQLDTYDWLLGEGFKFEHVEASPYQSVPRSHTINAATVVRGLHEKFVATAGAQYVPECRATSLLRNESGRVIGVAAQHKGSTHNVHARSAVVIATGGFARNDRLIEKFAPEFLNAVRMGGAANEGDGLLMAWALGADIADTGWLSGTFGASLNQYPDLSDRSGKGCILIFPIYKGGIAVNKAAERFTDESQSYKTIGAQCMQQVDGVAFQIFDQRVVDASVPNVMPLDFRKAFELGLVRTADNIAALARTVGLDATQLEATVATYNRNIDAGHDREFGRRHLVGEQGELFRLQTPPYYIYPCTTAVLATYGGLALDAGMRVTDVQGKPIAGLYAAGEVAGGLHGASYLSGSSLGKGAIFGRLAGRAAAVNAAS